MKLKFDINQNVNDVADSIDYCYTGNAIIEITNILCISYICAKHKFFNKLTLEQSAIVNHHLDELSRNFGLSIVEAAAKHYNNHCCIWARSNKNNYEWLFKLWVILNKKYFDIKQKPHKCFKFSAFLLKDYCGKKVY